MILISSSLDYVHCLYYPDDYLFKEVLELVDLDFKAAGDAGGCSQFHFMPRFVRDLPDNGKEILSMKEVLQYLLTSSVLLINHNQLEDMVKMSQYEWQSYADEIKVFRIGRYYLMVVINCLEFSREWS